MGKKPLMVLLSIIILLSEIVLADTVITEAIVLPLGW